ncbi:MAG TPA: DUF3305 domain-containing protein [Burkholderiales bacterium]
METSTRRVAVVMQRRAIRNRWQNEVWEPLGVLAEPVQAGAPRQIVDQPELAQWLYPGFEIVLRRAEAEGYFHNVSTASPKVFVLWRMEDARAVPHYVTVSYDEASRWMDGGASVDGVAMPADMVGWVRAFVERNYRPEPKKRIKPQSFLSPKDRART